MIHHDLVIGTFGVDAVDVLANTCFHLKHTYQIRAEENVQAFGVGETIFPDVLSQPYDLRDHDLPVSNTVSTFVRMIQRCIRLHGQIDSYIV